MPNSTISFRVTPTRRKELERVAKALDRDRSYVINEALEDYLSLQQWQEEEVTKGIADSDAGRTLTMEQMREQLAQWNERARQKPR